MTRCGLFRGTYGCSGYFDADGPPDGAEALWRAEAAYGDYPAVVVDGGVVWGVCRAETVVGLDLATGEVRWSLECDQSTFAPAVDDQNVYFSTNDALVAADRSDATQRWRAELPRASFAAPSVAENRVIVRAGPGRVCAFSTVDGTLIWQRADVCGSCDYLQLPTSGGLVYIGHDEGFHACRISTGEIEFSYNGGAIQQLLVEGDMAVAMRLHDPAVRVINAKTGRRERAIRLDDVGYPGKFPVLHDGSLYAACEDWGTLFRVDLRTGDATSLQSNVFGYGPLSLCNHRIYAVRSGQLVAVDSNDGTKIWSVPAKGGDPSPVVVSGERAIVATAREVLAIGLG